LPASITAYTPLTFSDPASVTTVAQLSQQDDHAVTSLHSDHIVESDQAQLRDDNSGGESGMAFELLDSRFERLIAGNHPIEKLATGFGSPMGPAEGPVWWSEGGYLLFSDIGNSRRLRWQENEGVTVVQEGTHRGNGMTRDPEGRLIACEHDTRRVVRIEPDGTVTVVANHYRGLRLNRPNDVVVRSDGSVYFTDPMSFNVESELDFAGVYRVTPDLARINLLTNSFFLPNGLAFSPDETVLYVNDTRARQIRAFDVAPNASRVPRTQGEGTLLRWTDRLFCSMAGDGRAGDPDGMKVDVEGNVYCTGPGGIWVIDASGVHLGTILIDERPEIRDGREIQRYVTNLAWGDEDWRTLYFTTWTTLCRIRLGVPGIPLPRKVVA
jgi:gluconolactonase